MNRMRIRVSPTDHRWPPARESADHRTSENRVFRPRSATRSPIGRAANRRTGNLGTSAAARSRRVHAESHRSRGSHMDLNLSTCSECRAPRRRGFVIALPGRHFMPRVVFYFSAVVWDQRHS
jgi:hypothetical protein